MGLRKKRVVVLFSRSKLLIDPSCMMGLRVFIRILITDRFATKSFCYKSIRHKLKSFRYTLKQNDFR